MKKTKRIVSGIYVIKSKESEKIYVGQSSNIYKRWEEHKRALRSNYHANKHLQRAFDKYGESNFEFSILENCTIKDLDERELFYINELKSYDSNYGYNATEKCTNVCHLRGEDNYSAKPVLYNGERYGSVIEFAKDNDLSYSKVKAWFSGTVVIPKEYIDNGLKYEDCNDKVRDFKTEDDGNANNKKVTYDGIVFNSINECSSYLNECSATISKYLTKEINMPKLYYDKGLRYFGDEDTEYNIRENAMGEKVICDNVIYDSIKDCCKVYDIKYPAMLAWLSGRLYMPQKFIDLGLRYKNIETNVIKKPQRIEKGRYVYCDGMVYRSLKAFTSYNKLPYYMVKHWMSNPNTNSDELKSLLTKGLCYITKEEALSHNIDIIDNKKLEELGIAMDIIKTKERCVSLKVTNLENNQVHIFESRKDYRRNGKSVFNVDFVIVNDTIRKYVDTGVPYKNFLFETIEKHLIHKERNF